MSYRPLQSAILWDSDRHEAIRIFRDHSFNWIREVIWISADAFIFSSNENTLTICHTDRSQPFQLARQSVCSKIVTFIEKLCQLFLLKMRICASPFDGMLRIVALPVAEKNALRWDFKSSVRAAT